MNAPKSSTLLSLATVLLNPTWVEWSIVSTTIVKKGQIVTNPNFWVRIFSGGVGVFHAKGWGKRSSVWTSKLGKSNFFGGISRDFAGISRRCPKSLRKKALCSIFWPLKQCTLRVSVQPSHRGVPKGFFGQEVPVMKCQKVHLHFQHCTTPYDTLRHFLACRKAPKSGKLQF